MAAKDLKNLIVVNGKLYHLASSGVLARALSLTKPKEELHRVYDLSYGKMNSLIGSNFIGLKWLEMLLRCR